MIHKRHCAYVLNATDHMGISPEADWLRRIRTALVKMNAILALVESKCDFSFPRMESCVAVGYFAAHEAEVEQWRY